MNIGDSATIAMLIPIVAIIGGFVLAGLGIYSGIRRREFEHRERLAMIEKGLAPTQAPGGPGPAPGGASPAFLADHEEMWRRDPFAADSMRAAQIRRGGFILTCIGI